MQKLTLCMIYNADVQALNWIFFFESGDDNREAQQPRGGSRGGGSFNRVWRRGKKVSFHDRRGGGNRGGISKRDNRDRDGRPQFDTSRLARVLGENDEQMGGQTSSQSGRARPLP